MLSGLIGLIVLLLQIISFALLVYCVMTFVMPGSTYTQKARGFAEPILAPFRELLYKFFPKLKGMAVDFSPLAVWLAIEIIIWLLNLLRRIF